MPGRTTWERHPADTARFVLAVFIAVVAIVITRNAPDSVRGVSADLVRLFAHLPNVLTAVVIGILQLVALAAPLFAVLWLMRGRWTEVALAIGTALVAASVAAMTNHWLRLAVPPSVIEGSDQPSWVTGSAFPSSAYLAATAAAVTVIGPTLTLAWRRTTWWIVATVAVARVITAVETPLNLVATISIGVAVGSAALMWFGAPARRPSLASVTVALAQGGLRVNDLRAFDGTTSHGPAYEATAAGRRIFVKVVGRDERNADLLSRLVRVLRVKGVEDDRPVTPELTVQREGLAALLAAQAGASVPAVLGVGDTAERASYVAFELLDGTTLADLTDDDLTDDVLSAAFENLAVLHRARIAHLWASPDHLVRTSDGSVAFIDFRWAELSASDAQMGRDLAEMLSSLALRVGPERVVAAARRHHDPDHLSHALPFIQPLALSSTTRKAVKHDKQLLSDLRAAVQAVADVEQYEMAAMQRVTVKGAVSFFGLLFLGNVLLLFVANFSEIWEAMRGADYSDVPLMVFFMLISYFGGVFSLMGAVNIRLPLVRTVVIMFAQSFLNRFIPANAGGMALRMRYLQRNGVDLVVAAGSVGLTSAASGVMQVVMILVFFTWAGQSAESSGAFSIPDLPWLLIILLLLVIVGIVFTTAFGKRLLAQLRIQVSKLWGELKHLAKRPVKMLMLFAGAGFGKVMAIVMLWQSLNAFGVSGIGFAQLGVMYITATTIASAVPTPGGVGAIEAALTAGLVGLGVDPATAAGVVVFFRLISYWLPVLPAWIAYRYVQRNELA
ncbi:MAG: flippase-like domain-containing protein [Actinobacteria bacterium]|nr:flippase-like domain-containing protein [Actinomycetota bacterium]